MRWGGGESGGIGDSHGLVGGVQRGPNAKLWVLEPGQHLLGGVESGGFAEGCDGGDTSFEMFGRFCLVFLAFSRFRDGLEHTVN